MSIRRLQRDFRLFSLNRIHSALMYWEVRVVRLGKFLSDLSRKTGPLLDCNDTLIDSTVNEMFGRFVSCRPGFRRSYWLAASLGNPTQHRSKPQSCLVSRRTMTSVLILIAFVFNLYVQKFLKKYRLRSLSYDKPSNLY